MKEIAVSKFKATCLAVLAEVERTGEPVRVTRFGKPLAEIQPAPRTSKAGWLGAMAGTAELDPDFDITGPLGAFEPWRDGGK